MKVTLKPVTKRDWKFILSVRNQKDVRLACHDTRVISYQKHQRYMEKISSDPDCYQWIILCNGKKVGHTKIIHSEFGYMVKDGFRGKGIGTQTYHLVFVECRRLGITWLIDTIKVNQAIPVLVASKVGFSITNLTWKNSQPYSYTLVRKGI
jgi:hypothetical protein